ncbi:MAG: transposase [Patescibacteria group bacterium]
MATRKFKFSVGEYYHLYNRGIEKRIIFNNTDDYDRFILLLYLCNSSNSVDIKNLFDEGMTFNDILNLDRGNSLVSIGSYVLMPNHFHILAKEVIEGGISKFMSKLSTGYSMYFNRKYKRSGSLFEGRFKIIHANRDEYLKYLFVYIHLNPIKLIDPSWKEKGIKDMLKVEKYLASYKYSSYLDYNGVSRLENGLLDINSFPEYFCSKKEFNDFNRDWLSYKSSIFPEGMTFWK